ncbi:MAG: restriction endonuclease subunit S [Succiniclasticum sp.]|uniref:restriction endonuclease subunit S n=1 Tax=Succiniclasticum sp. TaxID=2775030 RepID=UPI002A90A252|nr:restriction endonuclease subunit S [Succiniclasticum sp.]MDY6291368.1 restriction endonuclease subunit S [Succiniclasticum sp.]
MIDTQALRQKVLELAIRGKLTEQLPEDGTAEELYAKIQEEKQTLIKEGKIKKEKPLPPIAEDEIPFAAPQNWKWVRIGSVFTLKAGKNIAASLIHDIESEDYCYPCFGGNGLRGYVNQTNVSGLHALIGRQGALCGNINFADGDFYATEHAIVVNEYSEKTDTKWSGLTLKTLNLNQYATSVAQPGLAVNKIEKVVMPLPPLAEQKRIVEKIESIFVVLDKIDLLQSEYVNNLSALKTKIIEAGIQGKLTEQLPEDGTAEELFEKIQEERKRQIEIGIIKRVDLLPELVDSEMAFQVPDSWKWFPLGNISYIVRGGSPRPIKQYITADENGVNWIKIGDVEKGGKYIYATEEKIRPEGEKKSRRVYPGDFLLTNSMSFGRPYITKIEGCIHDGWLLIRNLDGFDIDYLYYLLSSQFLFNQFSDKASGSTVTNLNIDKVKSAAIPLPPLAEQKRIVAKLDAVLSILDARR